MDENIIITAHHEAGHALMAHIAGWTINSIVLNVQNGILLCGVTNYNFGGEEMNNRTNLSRRILCLMGGPIAQAIHQNNNRIDIDTLGQDGISIDTFLSNLDSQTKANSIQESINSTAIFLQITANKNARQLIADRLINNLTISQLEFVEIVNGCNVSRMDFN